MADHAELFKSKYPSDRIAVVLSPTSPPYNTLRRINRATIEIIKYQIKTAHLIVEKSSNPDSDMIKNMLVVERKIKKPYIFITIAHDVDKIIIDKMKQISGKIWKLFIKLSYVDPDIKWKITRTESGEIVYGYRFGIKTNELSNIMDILNGYGCNYQLVT